MRSALRSFLLAVVLLATKAAAQLPTIMQDQPILFVVRQQYAPDHHNTHTMFPAEENEHNDGSYTGGGSALKIYDPATGTTRTVLDAGPDGVIRDPGVHFDGQRIVFSWRKNRSGFYHLWEIRSDGSGLRQLTSLDGVDDIDPIYMPDDDIVFSSGREPKYVMCNKHLSYNLYRMNCDGSNILQIGKSTLFEGHPSLMPDGRILYDRWEYVDRNFGDAQGLWVTDPEGTGHAIHYGNNTSSPGGVIDGHAVPGTQQTICTFGSCHDRPWGAIALIDHRIARDGRDAVVRTWPAGLESWVYNSGSVGSVPSSFDQFVGVSPKHEDPFPVVDPATGNGGRYFLCSRDTGGGHMAIYLLDAETGGETLVHDEGAGSIGCFDPMPLVPGPTPNDVSVHRQYNEAPGRFYVMDVYAGTHMQGITRGDVKWLRVVESPEKRFYNYNGWSAQGFEGPGVNWDSFETKRILGTVPVEADGSAHFLAPPNTFLYFQLLDENKMMVQSMRSATIIQPGESQGCIGCHENRGTAPHYPGSQMPLAFLREPDTLNGWLGQPAKEFNYLTEVQPVFDAKCVDCHDYGGDTPLLAGDKGVGFNASYTALYRGSFPGSQWGYTGVVGAGPAAVQQAKSWGSHKSKLIETILAGHHGITLTSEEVERLTAWIDLNGVYYGSYASNFPGNMAGRSPLGDGDLSAIGSLTGRNVTNVKGLGEQISFDRPESSPCLVGVTGNNYDQALALIRKGQNTLATVTRADMPNFTMNSAIDLWREDKYQYRLQREEMNLAAMAGGGTVNDSQGLLAIAQRSPQGVDGISTRILGDILYSGAGEPANVTVAWGSTDGGDDPSTWQHNDPAGTFGTGGFEYLLQGLVPGQPLYYRIFAQNSGGTSSSHLSASFDTRSLIDLDGDGMADWWETANFGGTELAAAAADWDHDGLSNVAEYRCGSDPTDPQSRLRTISFTQGAPERYLLRWQSADKVDYEIWRSSNLTDWTKMPGEFPATSPINEIEIDPEGNSSYFFRIGGQHRER
ncbi:MAG: hypothetical protein K9M97_12625 [Akkermansiaceae bacterium]|nr:hypothetical protein [Akkermansiaceae bacterium]